MGGAFGAEVAAFGLADGFAEGDAHAAFVQGTDEAEGEGGESGTGAAGGKVKGVGHGDGR